MTKILSDTGSGSNFNITSLNDNYNTRVTRPIAPDTTKQDFIHNKMKKITVRELIGDLNMLPKDAEIESLTLRQNTYFNGGVMVSVTYKNKFSNTGGGGI